MVTKTITVTDDAYEFIKSLKGENESFSNLFERLAREKSILDKYYGVLKGDIKKARLELKKRRKETTKDFGVRQDVFFGHKRNS